MNSQMMTPHVWTDMRPENEAITNVSYALNGKRALALHNSSSHHFHKWV